METCMVLLVLVIVTLNQDSYQGQYTCLSLLPESAFHVISDIRKTKMVNKTPN